jgi:isopentenyl phosphate kinase
MPSSPLVFVKLGGSLLTDKHRANSARLETISRCAREIGQALRARPELRLLLAHGSGSFGHVAAVESRFGSGGVTGYAQTGAAAAHLNRIVTDIFLAEGLPVVSMQPSASALCDDGRLLELATHPIEFALNNQLIPLLFGDVAFDRTRGETIASTEMIFVYLAVSLRPHRIVLAGRVSGVYSADPYRSSGTALIPRITPADFPSVRALLGGSHGVDVTGGMLTKVEQMIGLVTKLPGLNVDIISGETSGLLAHALQVDDNMLGTRIQADDISARVGA